MSELAVNIAQTPQEMARRAAEAICAALCADRAVGAVCLSGGNTPRGLYALLARPPFSQRIPWDRIHWFFGDERFVPLDDVRSNFRMAEETLFSQVAVRRDLIHAIPTTSLDADHAAARYEAELQAFYGLDRIEPERPLFDVVILGLGADGHTASLLPGQPQQYERQRWALAAPSGAPEPRVTLTPPALNSAYLVAFLISGAEKRDALSKLRSGAPIPASQIKPTHQFIAFVDAQAAGV